MDNTKLVVSKYADIDGAQLPSLIDLIEKGGQVKRHSVEENLPRAEWIVMLLDGDQIVSTATVKIPQPKYLKRVFEEAGAKASHKKYGVEIGYIVTHPDHEGKGYGRKVMEAAMEKLAGRPAFATTRNVRMIPMLERNGFKPTGNKYGADKDLSLFIHN